MNGTTIFLDFETGGLTDAHPNIQLAAIAVKDWREVDVFEKKIFFDVKACDAEALLVNGYTAERWAGAPFEADVASLFLQWLRPHADLTLISKRGTPYRTCRLAGHNIATFDGPRLRTMMDRHLAGVFWPGCWWYPLDTYQRAIWWFTERGLPMPANFQLQTLAAHFGIASQGTAHDALADVRTCAKVAKELCWADAP